MTALLVGLDGSLTAFGWAVLTVEAAPRVARAGCITTKPDSHSRHMYAADQDGLRVDAIAAALLGVLAEARRDGRAVLVAIESPAGSQHAKAAKALGLAYGIARTVCMACGIVPITIQAHEAKRHVGGSMGASKADVAAGVLEHTGWTSTASTKPAREGEADAAAVALTAMAHPLAHALKPRTGFLAPAEVLP